MPMTMITFFLASRGAFVSWGPFVDKKASEFVLKSGKCLEKPCSVLNVDKKPSNYWAFHANKKSGSKACDWISFINGSDTITLKASTEIEQTGSASLASRDHVNVSLSLIMPSFLRAKSRPSSLK